VNAVVGEWTTLSCYSTVEASVDWVRDVSTTTDEIHFDDVVNRGVVQIGYEPRFTYIRYINGSQNIVIANTSLSDAGLYRCTGDGGLVSKYCVQLNVRGKSLPVVCSYANLTCCTSSLQYYIHSSCNDMSQLCEHFISVAMR